VCRRRFVTGDDFERLINRESLVAAPERTGEAARLRFSLHLRQKAGFNFCFLGKGSTPEIFNLLPRKQKLPELQTDDFQFAAEKAN